MQPHEEADTGRLPRDEPEPTPRPRAGADDEADLLRAIVGSVRDYAIFALDPTGRIATWNPGAEAIKGWRAEEIVGEHFSKFYPPEDVLAGKPDAELRAAAAFGRF